MTSTIKISSLELPHDDRYQLTKIKAKDYMINIIGLGDSSTGSLFSNPIVVGNRCGVWRSASSGISTSPVISIELTDDPAKVLLHTESESIYELINLDMVDVVEKV